MGKRRKSRKIKNKSKRILGVQRPPKLKRTLPDDFFRAGHLEFARYGKLLVGRNRANSEEFAAMRAAQAAHYPVVVAEIDSIVSRIAARVSELPADKLLLRSWWSFAMMAIRLQGKDVGGADETTTLRMLDYIQSVIVAVKPNAVPKADLSDEDWAALFEDVKALFEKLNVPYQIAYSAHLQSQNPNYNAAVDEFRFRAETIWANVRGERYQLHETQALLDVLSPHSDVFLECFGIDATTLVGEFQKILEKLSRGLKETFDDFKAFQKDTLDRLAAIAVESGTSDVTVLRDKLFEDGELASRRDRVIGAMFGFDLFDVEKVTALPKKLIDELTWDPGQDDEFFAPGPFAGWPLRVWPIMKRPFIRLNGRIYCFEMSSLFDGLYRVLQRIVFRLVPERKQAWNINQKAASEELPLKYFGKLLPGSTIYRNVFYRWKASDGSMQWHEADALIIFDDHLFVIEVKAGAFTYTSPATDLPGHIASLENLVRGPVSQGNRFVDYLLSQLEVSIFDSTHNEIAKLRRGDFRQQTVCAVTLDPFTELAARANQLRGVGIDVGTRPVWVVSVDDLRVYAEILQNPLVFLHFIEQRKRAAGSALVDLDDEMDHLGLYLEKNNYAMHAEELVGPRKLTKLTHSGFRTKIDEYFSSLAFGEKAALPRQEMPPRLVELIEYLAQRAQPGSAEIVAFLLDGGDDFRRLFAEGIDRMLADNDKLHRVRPFSTFGDMSLTLFCRSPSVSFEPAIAIEHTRVAMIAKGETTRPLIQLTYSAGQELIGVEWAKIGLAGLSATELERLRKEAEQLIQQRVLLAKKDGPIRANELCPCGSGRKYKKCCGQRS